MQFSACYLIMIIFKTAGT